MTKVEVAAAVVAADAKTTPVDADTVPVVDSADSSALKEVTWANFKATLKTYNDTLYVGVASTPVGDHSVWILATAIVPRTTSGAAIGSAETTTNKVMVRTLDFDAATNEYGQFTIRMPKSWDESTVTAYFLWSNSTGTGNVVWGLQGVALSNDDALYTAFGTAQEVTDGVTAAGDIMQSAETSAITISGTPAEGDFVVFQAYRNAADGSDTLTSDARLHGIMLIYTTDTGTDA